MRSEDIAPSIVTPEFRILCEILTEPPSLRTLFKFSTQLLRQREIQLFDPEQSGELILMLCQQEQDRDPHNVATIIEGLIEDVLCRTNFENLNNQNYFGFLDSLITSRSNNGKDSVAVSCIKHLFDHNRLDLKKLHNGYEGVDQKDVLSVIAQQGASRLKTDILMAKMTLENAVKQDGLINLSKESCGNALREITDLESRILYEATAPAKIGEIFSDLRDIPNREEKIRARNSELSSEPSSEPSLTIRCPSFLRPFFCSSELAI